MKMKEIRNASRGELDKILAGVAQELSSLRVKVASREHARVSELNQKRRLVARLKTVITELDRSKKI